LHQRWLDSDVRDRDDVAAMQVAEPQWQQPALPRF
jgi:glucarate dehydratase